MHVQYGCGFCAPEEWLNFDASIRIRLEHLPVVGPLYAANVWRFHSHGKAYPANVHFGDIRRGLPLPEASCDAVYSSHVLEHLCLADARLALENTRRILKPGGLFRLVVPDLECAARDYVAALDRGDPAGAAAFLQATMLGKPARSSLIAALYARLCGSRHLWMWDQFSLSEALTQHGFTAIRRCRFGDSEDPKFRSVEDPERFQNALALEARRA